MHPLLHAPAARALVLALVALALAGSVAAEGRLVDGTPPGGLLHLRLEPREGVVLAEAALPRDDDVTQARFAFVDAAGAVLAKSFAPAGPGETVLVRLALPPDATALLVSAVDGEGNAGPATRAAVDGSLALFTLEPKDAPLPAALAAGALVLAVALARR